MSKILLLPLLIALVFSALAHQFVRVFTIPSTSMQPALEVGDHILVTRYSRLTGRSEPERGDVIVFQAPSRQDGYFVKRLIARPGDLLELDHGKVRVNGYTLSEPYVASPYEDGFSLSQILPQDCYWVMGDRREDSRDSRHWGLLTRPMIVGRARVVFWSSQHAPKSGELASAQSINADVQSGPVRQLSRVGTLVR